MSKLAAALLPLALCAPAAAQAPCGLPGVTISVSPQSAAPGELIEVTLRNDSGSTIQLPSSCLYTSVNAGDCSAEAVFTPACAEVLVPIPTGTSHTATWKQNDNGGAQVPAGTYSFTVGYLDKSGAGHKCCAKVAIGGGPPACGAFSIYGAGCAGSTALLPKLSGAGCPAPGEMVKIGLVGGPPSAPAFLGFGFGTDPFPVTPLCNAEIGPFSGVLLPVPLSPAGTFELGFDLPAGFSSVSITMQTLIVDLAAPPYFVAMSNALGMKVP